MPKGASTVQDSSRLIRAWMSVECGQEMDVANNNELPDIPPPRSRADRLRRRQEVRDRINWDQRQDAAASTSEAQDQAKLELKPDTHLKKDVKKVTTVESDDVRDDDVMVEDAVVTVPSTVTEATSDIPHVPETAEIQPDSDPRRVKLFGYMEHLTRIMHHLRALGTQTHFVSDGAVYSSENKALSADFISAGHMLLKNGNELLKMGKDFAAMCDKIEDAKKEQERERIRRETARNSDDSTDDEPIQVLHEATPQPNCHNIESTGHYLVGKTSQREQKHKCSICGRSFQKYETLEGHKLLHTKDSLTCTICKMTCTSKEYMRLHMQGHAVGGFTCSECNAKFLLKTSYLNHVKKHSGETYPCETCGKKYASKSALNVHMRKEHLPVGDGDADPALVDEHNGDGDADDEGEPIKKRKKKSVKHVEKTYTCGICPKLRFKNVFSVRTHCSKWHPNKEKQRKD